MKKIILFLWLLAIAIPYNVSAWGKKGHQMVAEIGFGMLDAKTQEVVKKYLGKVSVANAGTWMDDMRNDPKYAYMKSWHFVNIDADGSYKPSGKADIVGELNRVINELKHKEQLTDAQIQLDILVLFHLIGDIAQPLHVGYSSDFGGNAIDVTYISKPSNLHKVWDSEIIEGERITANDCKAMFGNLSDEQVDVIKVIDPMAWMNHSRLLLDKVYRYKNDTISVVYVRTNRVVIKKQILYAGIRLAATLESLFKPKVAMGKLQMHGADTVTLRHTYYTSHFVNSAHIPWVVEYTLRASDLSCENPLERSNNFAPDPLSKETTNLDDDYKSSGYDRGHNMPAADNGCHGEKAMAECFYFSNMFPQTGRLNRGVWKALEVIERDLAAKDDSIYVWIGSYGVDKTIGKNKVVVPKYCWKVIYDYKTEEWSAFIFPNTAEVTGKPIDFVTSVADVRAKSGFDFR